MSLEVGRGVTMQGRAAEGCKECDDAGRSDEDVGGEGVGGSESGQANGEARGRV